MDESPVLPFPHEFVFLPESQLESALLTGEIDCAVSQLHRLPAGSREGISIAAIWFRRNLPLLLAHPDDGAPNLLQLKPGALVYAPHPALQAQIQEFRPDLQFSGDEIPGALPIALNPREFCPPPGYGAIALQTCSGDLATRRTLQTVHQPAISATTNVERKLLRLFGGDPQLPLGAWCERDAMGHCHLWAAYAEKSDSPVRRARLSSSTTFELAEQTFAAIQ
jgi:hydroxymethylbilane synthase